MTTPHQPSKEDLELIEIEEISHYLRYQASPLQAGNPFTKGAYFGFDLGAKSRDADIEELKEDVESRRLSMLVRQATIDALTNKACELQEKLRLAVEAMKKAHDADEFESIYPRGPSILKEALSKLTNGEKAGAEAEKTPLQKSEEAYQQIQRTVELNKKLRSIGASISPCRDCGQDNWELRHNYRVCLGCRKTHGI